MLNSKENINGRCPTFPLMFFCHGNLTIPIQFTIDVFLEFFPVRGHTCAAAVIPVAMLPRPANSRHPLAPVSSSPRHPVSAAKSKVAQLRRHVTPQVSSPIDI